MTTEPVDPQDPGLRPLVAADYDEPDPFDASVDSRRPRALETGLPSGGDASDMPPLFDGSGSY